jgi:dynein heavy chain 1
VIRRDDFISLIVTFDPLTLSQKQVKKVQEEYLSNSEMDYASVDRASKACGTQPYTLPYTLPSHHITSLIGPLA